MSQQDNNYKKLKDKINSHEFDFDPQAWSQMQVMLDGAQSATPPNKFFSRTLKIITAMLLILFFVWLFVAQIGNLPPPMLTQTTLETQTSNNTNIPDNQAIVLNNFDTSRSTPFTLWHQADTLSPATISPFFQAKLQAYNHHYAPEKVYLHLERTFFKPGEAIWFNAYVRDANSLKVSSKSDVLHVELLAPNGNVQKKIKLFVKNGTAAGDFQLAETAAGGLYKIRAYTQWQKNLKVLFERDLQVQASVMPNLRMKLEFTRKAYGSKDEVVAKLDLNTLANRPLPNHDFTATASLGGQQFTTFSGKTDDAGHARLTVQLPKDLTTNDGLLNVRLAYNGQAESISRSIPIVLNQIDLQFFPEGGDLVENIASIIAFKALNEFGKPADIEGMVLNSKGLSVATFKSYHDGMGAFEMTAKTGEKYSAKITKPEGIKTIYHLPEALPRGYALKVEKVRKKGLKLRVTSTEKEALRVVGRAGGQVVFDKKIQTNGDLNGALRTLNLEKLPIGITQLTLFDSKNIPRAERLVFVNPHKQLKVKIQTDKEKYLPREKVKMTVKVTDERGIPMPGNFSLAVTDDKLLSFADDKQGHILSHLLLESELKGEVEEPNFYFDSPEKHPEKDQLLALDYLMLTQGWRRFTWENMLNEPMARLEHSNERLAIAGKVLDGDGNVVANAEVIIKQNGLTTRTDKNGRFSFHPVFVQNGYHLRVTEGRKVTNQWFPHYNEHIVLYLNTFSKNEPYALDYRPGANSIQGKIVDQGSGEPILFGSVSLYQDGILVKGTETDFDGNYNLSDLSAGIYDVEITYTGYQAKRVKQLQVKKDKAISLNIPINAGTNLNEVVVTAYKVPLIEQDNTTQGGALTSEQTRNSPAKNINDLAATSAGVAQNKKRLKKDFQQAQREAVKKMERGSLSPKDQKTLLADLKEKENALLEANDDAALNIRGNLKDALPLLVDGVPLENLPSADNLAENPEMPPPPPPVIEEVPEEAIDEEEPEFVDQSIEEETVMERPEPVQAAPAPPAAPPPPPPAPDVDEIFKVVEEMPTFTGCEHLEDKAAHKKCADEKMMQFLYQNINYPTIARENAVEGTVVIRFTVEKDGSIVGAQVVRDIGAGCGQEALRLVQDMPKWNPGKQRGRPVAVQYNLPVKFNLDGTGYNFGNANQTFLPRDFHLARQFYTPKYEGADEVTIRNDFRSTIYWNPNLTIGRNGKATVEFYNSDDITTFRATVEGIGMDGGIGRGNTTYFTQMPFGMMSKVPTNLLTSDVVKIPLTLSNHTNRAVTGNLQINAPANFQPLETLPSTPTLKAGETKTFFLPYQVSDEAGKGQLKITFKAAGLSDAFEQKVQVSPRGFPVSEVYSGSSMQELFEVDVVNPIEGSVQAIFSVHPTVLSDLVSGLERMLRQPGGCFEQTSSSNYPNLLVLDYLQSTNTIDNQVEQQALKHLKYGYNRLKTFEIAGGGFDWFGRAPAHEGLTAYGLMQFKDMQAVYSVEQDLIDRTAKWLFSRKDGKGSWQKRQQGAHSWKMNDGISDAYITWALTEAGYGKELEMELQKSLKDAQDSKDPYILALMANALGNVPNFAPNELEKLIDSLVKMQNKNGSWNGKTTSVVNSRGQGLTIETTALATLALMKVDQHLGAIQKGIQFIASAKSQYGFGSTQSTVLAMKALVRFAKTSKKMGSGGEVTLLINGEKIASKTYSSGDRKPIVFENLAQYLMNDANGVEVQFSKTQKALPYDLAVKYTTRQPRNSNLCALQLKTNLAKTTANMGDNIRLTTDIQNMSYGTATNPIAIVGIPAGLSVQPWQLKELQEKELFDFYEIRADGYVVFYFRELHSLEQKLIHLDLKADIPGQYEAPASQAYLYYENEQVVWSKPAALEVK